MVGLGLGAVSSGIIADKYVKCTSLLLMISLCFRFGRIPTLKVGCALFLIFGIGTSFANSLEAYIALRFFVAVAEYLLVGGSARQKITRSEKMKMIELK